MKKSVLFLGLVVLVGAVVAPGALAQDSIEERLRALESRVQELARENADLKMQMGVKAAVQAPLPARPAGKESILRVGGFLQGQAEFGEASDPRWSGMNDRFFFRRARIFVAGSLAENVDFKAELDLQGNSLSAGTGHRAQANEIYVNWNKYPHANVRFGQLKTAFGGEQLMSDTKLLTIERYLGSDRLTDGRQLSVALLGHFVDKRLSYLLVAGNGNGPNVSANDNNKFQRSARIVATPFAPENGKLTVGLNGLWAEDATVSRSGLGLTNNSFAGNRSGTGVDANLSLGRLNLSAEWLQLDYRPANAVPDGQFDATGWNGMAAYFIVPDKVQAVIRRESFDPNSRRNGDEIDSWLFGLNYFFRGDDLKLQLNYLLGDGAGASPDKGRWLTRVQVMF